MKELESLVEKMVGSITQDHNDNNESEYLSKDVESSERVNGVITNNDDDNGIRVSFVEKNKIESNFDDEMDSSNSESEKNYVVQDNFMLEDGTTTTKLHVNGKVENDVSSIMGKQKKSLESLSDSLSSSSTLDSENCDKNLDHPKSRLYEPCCDFINNGYAKNSEESTTDNEVNRVGQCSKVYTHKRRRKNSDENAQQQQLKHRVVNLVEKTQQPLIITNRIDLIEDSSSNEAPVTLKTNLDNESSDYLLSFNNNSESIQSIIGCSLSDFCRRPSSAAFELFNPQAVRGTLYDKENDEEDNEEESLNNRPPVLRRSVRLTTQQENEVETFAPKSRLREEKKGGRSPLNAKLFSRTKRNKSNKDLERRLPNVKVFVTAQPTNSRKNLARPLRKTSNKQLVAAERCTSKNHFTQKNKLTTTNLTTSNNNNNIHMEKTEGSTTTNTTRTSSVNRALWGDMSDVAEEKIRGGGGELLVAEEFLEYSSSAEIPFAVGLLPLRAALERMQATLDHQPRKTRSSVNAFSLAKQEFNNVKRKNSPINLLNSQSETTTAVVVEKKLNNENKVDDNNSSAVCHVQITTSSPCSRTRKKSLSDEANSNFDQTTTFNGR